MACCRTLSNQGNFLRYILCLRCRSPDTSSIDSTLPGQYKQVSIAVCTLCIQEEDRGQVQIPVENYLSNRFTEKRAGCYAVYGKDKGLQYIGYARSVVGAIKVFQAVIPLLASSYSHLQTFRSLCMPCPQHVHWLHTLNFSRGGFWPSGQMHTTILIAVKTRALQYCATRYSSLKSSGGDVLAVSHMHGCHSQLLGYVSVSEESAARVWPV